MAKTHGKRGLEGLVFSWDSANGHDAQRLDQKVNSRAKGRIRDNPNFHLNVGKRWSARRHAHHATRLDFSGVSWREVFAVSRHFFRRVPLLPAANRMVFADGGQHRPHGSACGLRKVVRASPTSLISIVFLSTQTPIEPFLEAGSCATSTNHAALGSKD